MRTAVLPRAVATGAIVLLFCGCFSYRNHQPLLKTFQPHESRMILAVRASDVRLTVVDPDGEPGKMIATDASISGQSEAAEILNKVFDTLCRGKGNPMRGPSSVAACGVTPSRWKDFRVALDDPGSPDEPWKSDMRIALARDCGCPRVIVVRPTVEYTSARDEYIKQGTNSHWEGRVIIGLDDIDLASGRAVASGVGEAPFRGGAGIVGIGGGPSPYAVAIPYGFGKTFGRAADQAARKAFEKLFGPEAAKGQAE